MAATDDDELTYSLGGTDGSSFAIGEILEQMLATPSHAAPQRCAPPVTVPVPEVLQHYQGGVDSRSDLQRAAAGEGLMSELNDALIEQHSRTLKLPALRREYGGLACRARADSWSYEEYLPRAALSRFAANR